MKHNVAPVTPPYNPPEREPKATPRKREKKQEPGKASTEKPPAAEKTADRPADVDQEQLFIDAHQATGAELLQQSSMAESTETFDTSDPLTPFLAYVLFVLHYRNNPFADSWLIFKHSEMREIRDRKRAVLAHCRPWSTISHSEIDEVCLELLSLFEEAPKPESMNSGVFRTFAKALISAKLRVANHFKPGAKSYEVPGCNSKLYFFPVQSFPGPEPPGQAHLAWAHCSDVPGSVGIMASGRVIRSCLDSWPQARSGVDVLFRSMPHQYRVDREFHRMGRQSELEHKKQLRHRVWWVHGRKFRKKPLRQHSLGKLHVPIAPSCALCFKRQKMGDQRISCPDRLHFYSCRSRFGRLSGSIHAEYHHRQD